MRRGAAGGRGAARAAYSPFALAAQTNHTELEAVIVREEGAALGQASPAAALHSSPYFTSENGY
jgi:hypothetical protein